MNALSRILALVDDSAHAPKVLALAGRIASRADAELSAAYAVDPLAGTYLTPEVSATVVEIARQQFEQGRARAAALVDEAAAAAGRPITLQMPGGAPLRDLIDHSRLSDLIVLGQADPDEASFGRPPLGPQLLMGSGRPLLFVPYAGEFKTCGKRVLLAWADSRESARALHDALPLLASADTVEVVGFCAPGADIGARLDAVVSLLAAHGVEATRSEHPHPAPSIAERIVSPVSVDASIAEMLLSLAADRSTDLIVMGGYGHSRAVEYVLGGVTRTILQSMTVPVLMSH